MKKILLFLTLSLSFTVWSQSIKIENLLTDNISIRAIEIWDNKVWYTGSESKFGFVDINHPENKKQLKLSDKKLQFRTLGQDENSFYAINIERPAYFFKIDKKDLKSQIIFTDTLKTAFYDALHFHKDNFYTFSDPDKNLNLRFLKFSSKKKLFKFKYYENYKLNTGEAAFAASNTNIASSKKYLWLATGGKTSRIFRLNLKTDQFEVFSTPFIQGESSQGIYSIDFYNDQFGIAVGGDYTKQEANINNIATTNDGGKTWQIQASGSNSGYSTCVIIKPSSEGKEIVALGDQHISYSSDYGKTWKKLSDEKGFFVGKWVSENTIVLAGKNKISKLTFQK